LQSADLLSRSNYRKAAFELFERLGFTSLLNDYLPEAASAPPGSYLPIATPTELKRLLESAGALVILVISASLYFLTRLGRRQLAEQ